MTTRSLLPLAALGLALPLACRSVAPRTADEAPAGPRFETTASGGRWFKGNSHTHTILTDGDAPPDTVIGWYRAHGYQWLVISDHDTLVTPSTFAARQDSTFLLVPGNEVTGQYYRTPQSPVVPIHVTALNVERVARRRRDSTVFATLQTNVDAVREAGGVPHINHPNFGWALGVEDLWRVQRVALFELRNGHPLVNNLGGGGAPGTEEMWDTLLTRGKRLYGMGTDDAHHYIGEFAPPRANPGRVWTVVRAPRLEAGALMRALEAGDFYASTGVVLNDVVVTPTTMTVRIRPKGSARFHTRFIGTGGRVLGESVDTAATFALSRATRFAPGTRYVRAVVQESNGPQAWVQPVFVR